MHPGAVETWYDGTDQDCGGWDDFDADRNGYDCSDCGGSDCDDSDGSVHPGATEVCGNGVDDDCDGSPGDCGIWGTVDLADAKLVGEAPSDAAGTSVAGAGDVNGDGLDDLLVGAPANCDIGVGSGPGAAYLLYGPLSGEIDLAHPHAKLVGEAGFDRAGRSLAGAGDVDGDGFADVLLGSAGDDTGGSGAGAAYLLLGGNL